ncbi:MAG: chemotaxis-specific protein-glutamate methyltransferase CheB [Candidatus Omnitrophica bacterium]|nr:chemotaxis-specific protein-glutamate methyltransferase CheB [Candidatus Omnitrophota bacterium]
MLPQLKRILIVDDSPFMRECLAQVVNTDPHLAVVGMAHDGVEAVDLVPKLHPDLVIMDINMPRMDGFEATKQIMAYHPTPILIVSSAAVNRGAERACQALGYGALDVLEREPLEVSGRPGVVGGELLRRINSLAQMHVITHPLARLERPPRLPAELPLPASVSEERIITVAASTGGPQAVLALLKMLPKALPCAVVVVQHISAGFTRGLVEWLEEEAQRPVRIAAHGARLEPGVVYVAPTDAHLRVVGQGLMRLTDEPPCGGQKPSGTLLFASAASAYQERAIGVILSGMGSDGADGLKQLKAAGGAVIAQDERTCVVFGMPKAAIELGVVDQVLPIDEIADAVMQRLAQPLRHRRNGHSS